MVFRDFTTFGRIKAQTTCVHGCTKAQLNSLLFTVNIRSFKLEKFFRSYSGLNKGTFQLIHRDYLPLAFIIFSVKALRRNGKRLSNCITLKKCDYFDLFWKISALIMWFLLTLYAAAHCMCACNVHWPQLPSKVAESESGDQSQSCRLIHITGAFPLIRKTFFALWLPGTSAPQNLHSHTSVGFKPDLYKWDRAPVWINGVL